MEALLLAGQAAALAGLAWPGRPRWALPAAVRAAAAGSAAAGAALAVAGAAAQGRRLTPRVRPPAGAALQTTGPYRLSRHPIYTGLGAAAWGVAVLRRRPGPLLAALALTAVLTAKSRAEEAALAARFGDAYRSYAARTPRLLPRRAAGQAGQPSTS